MMVLEASSEASLVTRPARLSTAEALVPWTVGLLLSSPVLIAYYPPMTDLPYHEAAVGILRHFDDTSMFPAGLYERNLGEPNQLFHILAWLLSYFVSTRWAVKLVVAAAVLAIPVCAARFARHLGASQLASLVVAPIALGWLFSWGFVANLIGLAALLALLPLLDRFAREPSGRGALACVGAAAFLYFGHEAMLLVYGTAALVFALLYPWSRRGTALRLVPFLTTIAIAGAQARWQRTFMSPVVRSMPRIWDSLGYKLMRVPAMVLPAADMPARVAVAGLCAVVLGSFFWLRARERAAGARPAPPPSLLEAARAWTLRYRWELFAVSCGVAYLVLPLTLNGAALVYQRWFTPAFAVLAGVAGPRNIWTRAGFAPRLAAGALPVATLLVSAPSFLDSNHEYRELDRLAAYIEPGSAVADVDLGFVDPASTYSLQPAPGRILATRGGRLAVSFTDSPISPVIIPDRYQWNEALFRLGMDSMSFRPASDLRRFRYLLVRFSDVEDAQLTTRALRAEADYVASAGEWLLFRSRLPVVPLLSGEADPDGASHETLRDRIRAML